jgi:outer membrane protein OmpA-like peptidoglycan-associated protein
MKRLLLVFMAAVVISNAGAQNDDKAVSGGLTLALNLAKFRITGNNAGNIDYKLHSGSAGGFWLNVPLSKHFSFEPQLLYSSSQFKPEGSPAGMFNGKIQNISIPVMFKLNAGKSIGFLAGFQGDFMVALDDNNNNYDKDDFKKFNSSLTGGIEIFPHGRVTFFGRYLHGLKSLDNTGNPNTAVKFYSQNVYIGLKVKLFGHKKQQATTTVSTPAPAPSEKKQAVQEKKAANQAKDTDGDGILDGDDKCPTVAGIAKYQGCPIPDTDGDGVNDEMDRCPKTPGIAENRGCPDLLVYFKRDEFVLDPEDMKELDLVVRFLTNNADLNVTLEGHASTLGGTDYNQRLSQHRVDKSKEYLVSKGVAASRIKTDAKGEKFPIGDQKTEEGRAKSRRVHVKINF